MNSARSRVAPSVRAAFSRSAPTEPIIVLRLEYAIGRKRVVKATIRIAAVP